MPVASDVEAKDELFAIWAVIFVVSVGDFSGFRVRFFFVSARECYARGVVVNLIREQLVDANCLRGKFVTRSRCW